MVTAFKKCEGVSEAKVDCKSAVATVTYDPAKTNPDNLLAALKGTKYTATKHEEKKVPKEEPKKPE